MFFCLLFFTLGLILRLIYLIVIFIENGLSGVTPGAKIAFANQVIQKIFIRQTLLVPQNTSNN
jgi:hypothetical protein